MYVLDTNIFILAIAGIEPESSFLNLAIEKNSVSISVITVAEFLTRPSVSERRAFEKLLSSFPILEINLVTARIAGSYRKRSLKKTRVQMLDCLLAAQARERKLTLVTNNTADFKMKDIKITKPNPNLISA